MSRNRLLWQLSFILIVAVAGWAGFRIGGQRAIHPPAAQTPAPAAAAERKPLYWYDPMKPDQHFDRPGKSPFMDMELVPKYAEADSGAGAITVSAQMTQTLGIRLARVTRGTIETAVEGAGTVGVDDNRIEAVQARSSGWLEQLEVRAQGEAVRRGQKLAEIYAPELYAAQQELLLAQRAHDAALVDASRERLRLLGVSASQIAQIERSGVAARTVALYAPRDGIVQELGARLGMQLAPGTTLFSLADLSRVWVLAEIPEAAASQVRTGMPAHIDGAGIAHSLTGRVDYVYPEVAPQTRTLKIRVALANPGLALKPGMYARVRIDGGRHPALLIPSEALIRTGSRSVVIIALDGGRYRPAEVHTGTEAGGQTEILDGLEEGEEVVASGQFLIDSEANLRGALSRLAVPDDAAAGHAEYAP